MKLLTKNQDLSREFSRLIRNYPNMSFAVAWASANTAIFQALVARRSHIRQGVIGTHFYQTHPDVLVTFAGSTRVRFILQPKGVFHPKVYIFWDGGTWEALIGSANLTAGALNENSETMLLMSGEYGGSDGMKDRILKTISDYWSQAVALEPSAVLAYRSIWERQQPALRRLSGQYGASKPRKAPSESSVMTMTWSQFYEMVKADPNHGFKNRCDLLRLIAKGFANYTVFAEMPPGLQRVVAGLPTQHDARWAWFGSMKGSGYFHGAVKDNNRHLSRALDLIPLQGLVQRDQFERFIQEFIKAFPKGRHGLATASRLLAMKRPDQFVCVDAKNLQKLCRDFGISQAGLNYERYWEEIVERILDAPWWNSIRPTKKQEAAVWDARAAMLDAIFYQE